jgi:hypothetical protein
MKKIIAGIEEKGGLIEKIFKAGIKAGIAWNGNGYNRPSFGVRLKSFFPYQLAKLLVFNKVKKMGGAIYIVSSNQYVNYIFETLKFDIVFDGYLFDTFENFSQQVLERQEA